MFRTARRTKDFLGKDTQKSTKGETDGKEDEGALVSHEGPRGDIPGIKHGQTPGWPFLSWVILENYLSGPDQ